MKRSLSANNEISDKLRVGTCSNADGHCGSTIKSTQFSPHRTPLIVLGNLLVGAYQCKTRATVRERLDIVSEYSPRLKELRHRTAGYLSGGEQQMLVMGQSMMASPIRAEC